MPKLPVPVQWLLVGIVLVLLWRLLPRYEYRQMISDSYIWVRIDHWTGQAQRGRLDGEGWAALK